MRRPALPLAALHAALISVALAGTPPAVAQSDDDLSPLRRAELSARLHAVGAAAGDPLLILAAAQLRKTIRPQQGSLVPEGGGDPGADAAPAGWEEMLAEAASLAPDDPVIATLIDDIRAETTKGVISGPIYGISALAPGRNDTYRPVVFEGGSYAEVYVEARARTDLKLYVEDDRGRLVCSDTDSSHIAYCGWRPAQTGSFTVRVENRGDRHSGYALMTN